MSCLDEATVLGWIDDRLSPEDRLAAQSHTLHCPACLELVAVTRALRTRAPERNQVAAVSQLGTSNPTTVAPDQRYRLGSEIGAGGMGTVFESHDLVLGRSVAIKMVRHPSPGLVARFRGEVAIASMLQHPSIVPVYDAGTFADGSAFCAMRLVRGDSFDRAIGAGSTVNDRIGLLPALIQAADAIGYAHSKGIIHRDLKPQNILLGPFGETIVLDWGLAKKLGDQQQQLPAEEVGSDAGVTECGQVLGTPGYMSPEQSAGEQVDKRSDVYALGMMLKQTIFGVHPSELGKRDLPLRMVPKDLAAIAERATNPEPAQRYASAREFADDLKRFETGQLVSAQKYSLFARLRRWTRPRRGYIAASILAAALVAGALVSDSLIEQARQLAGANTEPAPEAQLMQNFMGLITGRTRKQQLQEQQTAAAVNETLAAAQDSTEQQRTLAASYEAVGDTHFRFLVGDIDTKSALVEYRKAVAIRQQLVADDPQNPALQKELAHTQIAIADALYHQYNLPEARAEYQQAMQTLQATLAEAPASSPPPELFMLQNNVARIDYELGNFPAALKFYRAIVTDLQRRVSASPTSSTAQMQLCEAHGRVAEVLTASDQLGLARNSYQACIAVAAEAGYVSHEWKRLLATHHLRLGRLLTAAGKPQAANESFATCAALYKEVGFSRDDSFDAACCSALAGDADTAFAMLQRAFESRWFNTVSLEVHPDLQSLHNDLRWRSLLNRMDKARPK